MTSVPYTTGGPLGSAASFGLIVLQVDETIERDFRTFCSLPDVALYVTRIPSGADLTPDTIDTMRAALPAATGLLPQAVRYASIGYGCTSATAQFGPRVVADLVGGAADTAAVSDPLTAALAGLQALRAQRVAIVSPYIPAVAAPIRRAFAEAGHEIAATLSFGEVSEARVARITPASIRDAVIRVAAEGRPDAIFVSCTNLRASEIVARTEAEIGIPILTSNTALAWHMFRQAGLAPPAGPGALMRTAPPVTACSTVAVADRQRAAPPLRVEAGGQIALTCIP